MLDRWFHLAENHTTIQREALGGLTTFFTLSYIIFMQPALLSVAGMDMGAVMAATCIASAFSCLIMGLYANYPIALAPGVGLNVFFTFTVCVGMEVPWQAALGAVFISGLLFVSLTALGLRRMIMNIIPQSMKIAIGAGIGLMISLLGFQWGGVVVDDQAVLIGIGRLTSPSVLVSGIGLITAIVLLALEVRSAILIGMAVSTFAGLYSGMFTYQGVFAAPPSLAPTFLQMDPLAALKMGFISIIFVFFIVDLFDTIGTLVGVAELGGFMKEGELPRANQALFADAAGTTLGAMLGTSTVTSYVESSAGISSGARTGLASVVTAILFIAALFLSPLVKMLGSGVESVSGATVYPAIAPALIIVGYLMIRSVKMIPWDDITEAMPAFLTIVMIAFSFSITEGIAFGFISYTLLKSVTGKFRDIHPLMAILSVIFVFRYFFMTI